MILNGNIFEERMNKLLLGVMCKKMFSEEASQGPLQVTGSKVCPEDQSLLTEVAGRFEIRVPLFKVRLQMFTLQRVSPKLCRQIE